MKKLRGVIGYLGMPGTGKTFRMKMDFWDEPRVVAYNFASGFGPVGKCKPNQNPLPGFTFVYSIPDLIRVFQRARAGRVRVCFTPVRIVNAKGEPVDKKDIFNDVSKYVCDFSQQHGRTVYAVDEVWNGQTASWSPEHFNECFCQWRHYDIVLQWTAQRPADTDLALRGMSTEMHVGQLQHEDDIKAVRKCGFSRDLIEKIPLLPKRVFIHRYDTGEVRIEK